MAEGRRGIKGTGMDLFSVMFFAAFTIVILVLPFIYDPGKKKEEAPPPQGDLMVEMFWPDDLTSDVDIWVKGPEEKYAVGYMAKNGKTLNLLRDDRGELNDLSGRNMELVISRGIPDGEYQINIHMFNLNGAPVPVPIRIVVSRITEYGQYVQMFATTKLLCKQKEEKTAMRFLMYDGKYVKDSAYDLYENLSMAFSIPPADCK